MIKKVKNYMGGGGLPKHPKKHHKPFLARHIGLFMVGMILVIFSIFNLGFYYGRSQKTFYPSRESSTADTSKNQIKSSLGFQFSYDSSSFRVTGKTTDGDSLKLAADLMEADKLSSVTIKPKSNITSGKDALSELSITSDPNSQKFETFKNSRFYSDENQELINYFAPKNDSAFNYELVSQNTQDLGGIPMAKLIYKQTPKFSSSAKAVYEVVWVGLNQGKPIKIELKNLLDSETLPIIYDPIFASLKIGVVTKTGYQPLAFSLFSRNDKKTYAKDDISAVSPAVVKIYHIVCGTLVVNGKTFGKDACDVGTGSGFLISSDGYIATSGHVVSRTAPDILVGEFLANPNLLSQFTQSAGLSSEDTSRSDVVASLLAKLYDLPSDKLNLKNRQDAVIVSLGNSSLNIESQQDARLYLKTKDDDFIKNASLEAIDYNPKDLLVIEQGTESGFSASDVAVLKIKARNTPFIKLADESKAKQNDPLSLIGFPGDAENKLTSNESIEPSVTRGTISSIRKAKGNNLRLFQTDADASQGSSGGPAINSGNEAFGILTYRFKDSTITDAAKSYIRDIADLKSLISKKNIALNTNSPTQTHWEKGLELFNQNRFSASLPEFKKVLELYPAHRLAYTYGVQAQQAVDEGRGKNDPGWSLIGIIYGGIAGFVGIILGAALIAHHRRHHLAYKQKHLAKT